MAQIKIVSVNKRVVVVDVAWDDGLTKTNVTIPEVPVESISEAIPYMQNYISGLYTQARKEADKIAYDNPTIDPLVLATVGHVFDNDGNLIS